MALVVLVPISLIFLLIAFTNFYQRYRYRLPPGPTPRPIFGNLNDIKPVKFRCFYEWAEKHGPIISFWLGSQLNVVVSNSELAKQVLQEHDQNLSDRYRGRSFGISSRGGKDLIWADYGPHFVKLKKFSSMHLFSQKKVDALRYIREDEVNSMIAQLFQDCNNSDNIGKALTIRKYLEALSLSHITRITFGKRLIDSNGKYLENDPSAKKLKAVLTKRLDNNKKFKKTQNFLAEYVSWLWWLSPMDKDNHNKYNATIGDFVKEIIQEHSEGNTVNVAGSTQHFVHALLSYKDEYDLDEDNVITLLWDMVIAGIDTIAISVEWALAELIRNPRAQKKAQEELDQVIGPERKMTEDDFSNLPYLQALTKESLRLHPPTPLMLPHMAKAHVKIGGYDIPKDSIMFVNVWALGRDPNVWPNPNEFRPERFLEENIDIKGSDFRVLPFGSGRRICPGAQMGLSLIVSVLGHLLHRYNWNSPDDIKPENIDMGESPGHVTYMRTPLQSVIVPRLSTNLYEHVSAEA